MKEFTLGVRDNASEFSYNLLLFSRALPCLPRVSPLMHSGNSSTHARYSSSEWWLIMLAILSSCTSSKRSGKSFAKEIGENSRSSRRSKINTSGIIPKARWSSGKPFFHHYFESYRAIYEFQSTFDPATSRGDHRKSCSDDNERFDEQWERLPVKCQPYVVKAFVSAFDASLLCQLISFI